MNEMDDLFALARAATVPPAGARERVLARVMSSVPGGPGGGGGAAAPLPTAGGVSAALAGALVFALAAALGGALYIARTSRPLEPSPSVEVTTSVIEPLPTATNAGVSTNQPPLAPPPVLPRVPRPLASTPSDSLAAEVALIRSAQSALGSGDSARALRELDEHARRFPKGKLGQEREVTRVRALCRGGRVGEAKALYRALEKGAPRSPHLASLRASCPALKDD